MLPKNMSIPLHDDNIFMTPKLLDQTKGSGSCLYCQNVGVNYHRPMQICLRDSGSEDRKEFCGLHIV